jgi:hypothetical protein
MSLREETTKRMLPASGGWYWWREYPGAEWEPIKVAQPANGWGPSINRGSHTIEVQYIRGCEWGPEIIPPNPKVRHSLHKIYDYPNYTIGG